MHNPTIGWRRRPWRFARAALPLFIGAVCIWLVQRQLGAGALPEIGTALTRLSVGQWAAAALATAVSFWAVGQYDVLIHRHLATGYGARPAGIAGSASIALGQLLGMGIIVGGLARWRMLPGLSPTQAMRVTLTVTAWFFFGLVGVFALVSLVSPVAVLPGSVALFLLGSVFLVIMRAFLNPRLTLFRKRVELLPVPALLMFLIFALIDTLCAAVALWVLMPPGMDISLAVLFPAYLGALTAALVTGTPGGVGPFELTLLVFLPAWPEAEVMTGIVAFRLIYYALPGVIAMAVLCRPFGAPSSRHAPLTAITDEALQAAPRAELGVSRQNGARALAGSNAMIAVATTPQAKVALFDPLRGHANAAVPALLAEARRGNRAALIYKASARHAARCRRAGLKALHICDEMVLNPATFTTEGASFRQLRRKLRQAVKAGVTVQQATTLPVRQMRAVDREWQAACGAAHGFSMGTFCPRYLRHQQVFLAYHQGNLVGFVSFSVSDHELCLDLMRAGADAPDGTMYLLVQAAIARAAQDGRRRMSLAALPPYRSPNALTGWAARRFGRSGLDRFKSCFAPRREPLYALALSWPGMMLALADVARAVHRPDTNCVHIDDEDYEFAPIRQT